MLIRSISGIRGLVNETLAKKLSLNMRMHFMITFRMESFMLAEIVALLEKK
tara:strand:+ start:401 stop:553 length:153 start_codon:yes stop_codon:yes gene_type:complete